MRIYRAIIFAGVLLVSAFVAYGKQQGILLWEIEAGQELADKIGVTVLGEAKEQLPNRLFQNPADGPVEMVIHAPIPIGTYELEITYVNPEEKACALKVKIDERLQPVYQTYYFDSPGQKRTYRYPVRIQTDQRHAITVGIFPLNKLYYRRYAKSLQIQRVALRKFKPERVEALEGHGAYLDLWGWMACIDYQRSGPASLECMKEKTVVEPYKWGANFVQMYPYVYRRDWAEAWGREEIEDYLSFCHEHGFLVDEHAGANPRSADKSIQIIRNWGLHDGNLLAYDWAPMTDTWEIESMVYALGCLDREEEQAKTIEAHHMLWSFNPGSPFNLCGYRPNSWRDTKRHLDFVTKYRGPNCVRTTMCASWCEVGGNPPIMVLGYTDMNPIRVFPDGLGLNNGSRDLFFGYQADSRMFAYAPPDSTYGSVFGGATTPDLILRQADDFARPRAMNPAEVHESAIWWLGETAEVLPPDLRDAVYAASMDPIKHGFTGRLAATGFDGAINSRMDVYRELTKRELHCPWWPHANEHHPRTTAFVQNNYFRLLRYADGDFGILQFDPQRAAHYDSNSLAVELTSLINGNSGGEVIELADGVSTPWRVRHEFRAESGRLVLDFGEGQAKAATVDVVVDGVKKGEVKAYGKQVMPIDFGPMDASQHVHEISLKVSAGSVVEIEKVDFVSSPLKRGDAVFVLDQVKKSDEEKAELFECDLDKGERLIPARLSVEGDSGPRSFRMRFDQPKGNYQLRIEASGEKNAEVRVYRDGWSSVQAYGSKENRKKRVYKFGRCGEFGLENGEQVYNVAVDLNYDGEHTLEIEAVKGQVELYEVSLYPAMVEHRWVERGGNRAVLEEKLHWDSGDEVRRYTADNDCPWIMVEVESPEELSDWGYGLRVEKYDRVEVDGNVYQRGQEMRGGRIWRFMDGDGVQPTMVMIFDRPNTLGNMQWGEDGIFRLGLREGVDELKLRFVASECFDMAQLSRLAERFGRPGVEIESASLPRRVRINDSKLKVPTIVKVKDSSDGPYRVYENGYWWVRGGQPSREYQGMDYVKVYPDAEGEVAIEKQGFRDGIVRAGWGSQNLIGFDMTNSGESGINCEVKVTSATAYIFAPRVEFNRPFTRVTLDGRPWPYFDPPYVFLPTRQGTYQVGIQNAGELMPRLVCSSGMLQGGAWDSEQSALHLKIGLQPWSCEIPEGQDYFATIKHAGYKIKRIEGAKRVEFKDLGVSAGFRERMGARGFTVCFRPATAEQPKAGSFTIYFEKKGE